MRWLRRDDHCKRPRVGGSRVAFPGLLAEKWLCAWVCKSFFNEGEFCFLHNLSYQADMDVHGLGLAGCARAGVSRRKKKGHGCEFGWLPVRRSSFPVAHAVSLAPSKATGVHSCLCGDAPGDQLLWMETRNASRASLCSTDNVNSGMSSWPTLRPSANASARLSTG